MQSMTEAISKKVKVVAVDGFDPSHADGILTQDCLENAPGAQAQLPFHKGQCFEILTKKIKSYWLYVRCISSQKEGFIPSICVVPLREDLDNGKLHYLMNGGDVSPSMVNRQLDSKFFPKIPCATNEKTASSRKPCPEGKANLFSRLSFWWLNSLILTGFRRPLQDSDLWALEERNLSCNIVPRLHREWDKELKKYHRKNNTPQSDEQDFEKVHLQGTTDVAFAGKKCDEPSLVKAMMRVFAPYFVLGIIFKLLNDIMLFIQPYLLGLLIEYTEDKDNDADRWKGYVYVVCMVVVAGFQVVAVQNALHIAFKSAMRVHTSIIGVVYAKALSLSNLSRKISTAGEMVNLMAVDAQRVMQLVQSLNQLWSAPFQICLAVYFLYVTMGVAVLAGVGMLILLVPLNFLITRLVRKIQVKQMENADERIKLMNEVLSGIKVLKLYAWEESFMNKITAVRNKELRHLINSMYLGAAVSFTFICAPFLVSLATFTVYVLLGNELTAGKAFVAISLFNILRFPLAMLPRVIMNFIQAQVSFHRLEQFLKLGELRAENVIRNMPSQCSTLAVRIENGTFCWDRTEDIPVLRNINVKIPSGSLVAVVGQVGCGKSTLLSSLLGETEKLDGKVYVKGTTAYIPQQAWIQNATLQENVLFGQSRDPERYKLVISACALDPDIEVLPAGDLTEIGEKGINLSGGQKQRVSLARSVYFNADIYLLDDPLSAVDSHVGKHIFDRVIGPRGKLRKKTRVLVTHGISFLPQVDQIIVLQDGRISEVGTYTELVKNRGAFAEFLRTYATEQQTQLTFAEDPVPEARMEDIDDLDGNWSGKQSIERLDSHLDVPRRRRADSLSVITVDTADLDCQFTRPDEEMIDKMIEEEKSKTGQVKLSVFWEYAKSLTVLISLCFILFLIIAEAASISSGIWLAKWSSTDISSDDERDLFLGVYGALGVTQAFFVLFSSLVMATGTKIASRHLHQRMLVNIMHSPMSFFETTPQGRIMNRFSKDISGIDDMVPRSLMQFVRTFLSVVGTLFAISFATPIFLAVIIPLGLLYIFIQRVYVASSRQLKRIESVSRSPIYNNFLETINGTSTIRAFAQQQRFIRDNYSIVDENQVAYYPSVCANRWLAVHLEFVGNMIIFFAALFAVVNRNSLESGLVGLSITYALQVTATLNWMVRMSSEVETNIVSVERVKEYSETPTEADWVIPDNGPPDDWPDAGNIVIEEFDLKYREGLPLVLKAINCDIKPGEKIGIVGRTGAGKSTLTLALFRILERAGGRIVVDGVDIAKIGLQDLRSRLTIIPQDPVLFSGTLRLNLDPFDSHTDEDLWKILEMSHLKNFVSGLDEGLLHPVSEGGENLSVGQRQLVCLARALLRKSKILVLDEATAAVDLETDELIQQTIRREFADRTVFTIAHRLNTIMDYTRIMVLDKGFMMEFDTPQTLLAQQGIFYGMARDAGLA